MPSDISIVFASPETLVSQALDLLKIKPDTDLVGYKEEETVWAAHRDDLAKLETMGLGSLALKTVVLKAEMPLLHREKTKLMATADYAKRLSEFFPVYFVAALYEMQSLMQRFQLKGYVVGGLIRDLLLTKEKRLSVVDVDVTLEGDAIAFAEFLLVHSRNFTVLETFPEFGTAKIAYKESLMFDLASTRQEVYTHCGALPVVVNRGVPLVNDIVRRDFAVNSLAFSIHELGKVLDYANGVQDIEKRHIGLLHPVSFWEDPSRILRALKFCARFDFTLSPETKHLLHAFLAAAAPYYKGGGDRIKQELKGLFRAHESNAKGRWLVFFLEAGCFRLLNMETHFEPSQSDIDTLSKVWQFLPAVQQALAEYIDADFSFDLYLCFLFQSFESEDFLKTAGRLGLTRNERERIEQFRKLKPTVGERFGGLDEFSSPAQIYALFSGLQVVPVCACLIELALHGNPRSKQALDAYVKYKRKWEKLELELDGNDLIGLGVPEGKLIGSLLSQLRQAKLAGLVPERLDEVQFIQSKLAAEMEQMAEAKLASAPAATSLKQAPHHDLS